MQVTLLKNWPGTILNPGHRKEKHFKKQITAFSKDLREVITVRFYNPGGSKEYCCVWINTKYLNPGESIAFKNQSCAYGSGSSTGGSALWEALQNAGIEIKGLRDDHAEAAVKLICEYFKADISFIHEAQP